MRQETPSNGKTKEPQLPAEAVDPAKTELKKDRRAQDLLNGKVQPQNAFQAYVLTELRKVMSEGSEVNKKLQHHRAQVKRLEEYALRLEGMAEKGMTDLMVWDRPFDEPTVSDTEETS